MLTTFNEIDMFKIIEIRKKYNDKFFDKYQVKLGFMSFFTKAAITVLTSPGNRLFTCSQNQSSIKMLDKLGVKIIGLIDNMSHFIGDDGKKYSIFGEGGVKKTAEEFKKEFLGEIPINPEVGKQGDLGMPIVENKPEHEISKLYLNFAEKIKSLYL